MNREYLKWYSSRLGREMELLVFGHAGLPVIVFPTSGGRFYEFEDRRMVAALAHRIEPGNLQLYCVDAIDHESWYNKKVSPRWRIARHCQFEDYVMNEVLPLIRTKNQHPGLVSAGCSFGGFHAANIALRHPGQFSGLLSMSGAYDMGIFLNRYHDQDVYFHQPAQYIPNLGDLTILARMRRQTIVLATGWDDQCLGQNQELSRLLGEKAIPHQLYIWETHNSHDWPTWEKMVQYYL